MISFHRHAKRIVLESLGWLLVVVGIAALILPGPGLLILVGGLALLATQYEWAERRLEPLHKLALKGARQSVETKLQIVITIVFSLGLIAAGIVWGIHPAAPSWWFLADKWWLSGGWGTGSSIIFSGLLGLGVLVYSYLKFRRPQK
jgi:hypothetical protein